MAPISAKISPPAVPISRRARIPPISEPPRPRPMVAYQGIGSGPGSARRASPPMMNPHTISPMMKNSTSLSCSFSQLLTHEEDPLHDCEPRRRRQQVDRPLQRSPRCEDEPSSDHHDALGARPEADVAAQSGGLGLRARVTDQE